MAFGISCSLTTKRKNKIEDEDTRATLRASKGGPHGPVDIVGSSKTRYAGQRHLPTLLTCGLSDPLFFGEPKWPRQKKKRFAATGPVGGFDSELEDGLPAVCLTRPTRFGYSRQSREAYAKSREADLLLKAKMRSLKFPVLDMLHPTSVDKSVWIEFPCCPAAHKEILVARESGWPVAAFGN
ncbi:hypothetical protein DIPPA_10494 [Diplonema papillatum]|nr:hypothetical protein DIPPA_10494 [Diplonema papillatum]